MSRITKQIKTIADAHIMARIKDDFDDIPIADPDDLKRNVLDGKTYSALMDAIEIKYSTISSTLMCRQFGHVSESHRKAVYDGFKELFNKWNL